MVRLFCLLLVIVACCSGAPKPSSRLLGGTEADIKDTPYTASIEEIRYRHDCGAVIISSEWVLTDAFCQGFPTPDVTRFQVRVGSSTTNNGSVSAGGVVHSVLEWIPHPEADLVNRDFDYALLKVSPPFVFNENVSAAILPDLDEETPADAVAVVSGWGETSEGSFGPVHQLYSAQMSLVSDSECNAFMGSSYNLRTLCANGADGGVALCWHDEGNPLVANGKVYGIALWTNWCGLPAGVQLFSRIASVRDWIDATINP